MLWGQLHTQLKSSDESSSNLNSTAIDSYLYDTSLSPICDRFYDILKLNVSAIDYCAIDIGRSPTWDGFAIAAALACSNYS